MISFSFIIGGLFLTFLTVVKKPSQSKVKLKKYIIKSAHIIKRPTIENII
jgi:hypothetical protein